MERWVDLASVDIQTDGWKEIKERMNEWMDRWMDRAGQKKKIIKRVFGKRKLLHTAFKCDRAPWGNGLETQASP